MTDQTTYAPLRLAEYEHERGLYHLMLTDDAMVAVMDVFERCGRYGNGYGWEGVAHSAVRSHAPDIADGLEYDPEAGTFLVRSRDLAALQRLAALLAAAFHSADRLTDLIRASSGNS